MTSPSSMQRFSLLLSMLPTLLSAPTTNGQCANYNPQTINWQGLGNDIMSLINDPACEIFVDRNPVSPQPCKRLPILYVRSAFHDAGTTVGSTGGSDGSIILSALNPANTITEDNWAANQFPFPFIPYVRQSLTPLVTKYQASWADTLVVAGAVSSEFAGRQPQFTVKVGRCDDNVTNPEVLPGPGINCREFVDYWAGQGVNIRRAVALMGSHVMIRDGAGASDGVLQYTWSNKYFQDLTTGTITVTFPTDGSDPTVTWIVNGVQQKWRYTLNDALIAPQNVLKDTQCTQTERNQISMWFNKYAGSSSLWDSNYEDGYNAMTTTSGVTWAAVTQKLTLGPCVWVALSVDVSDSTCASTCTDMTNYPNTGGANCPLVLNGQCKCT